MRVSDNGDSTLIAFKKHYISNKAVYNSNFMLRRSKKD
jgi:hypothetical protein